MHVHISARHKLFDLKLKELWQYRDLILLYTKRSFTVAYKQTILGPAWLFITPLLTSLIHVVLFGNIANLSTDGIPQLLFYLTGNTIWGYFSACLTYNSSTFIDNAHLFGKVYFPRLVIPVANVLGCIIRFGIQMILVLAVLAFFVFRGAVAPNWAAWLLIPVILIQIGVMGMGFGIIISSLTTKYRDLKVLVTFGIQLWMYATPVVYPLSTVSGTIRQLLLLNPVTMPIEMFRYAILGTGTMIPVYMIMSWVITVIVALLGIIVFNKVERTFMDMV